MPTFGTGDQAVVTKALATGAAHAHLCAILLATGAAHGAIGADQCGLALAGGDMVGAQMAATLAHATLSTLGLTMMADVIGADRARTDVFGTGAFATGPAILPTTFAILLAAGRTRRHATTGTNDRLAGGTLA